MKHAKFIIILLIVAITHGCSESFFDDARTPATLVTDADITNNYDLELLTAGSYYSLSGSLGAGFIDYGLMIPDLLSDQGVLRYEGRYTPGEHDMVYERIREVNDTRIATHVWQYGYSALNNVNRVIDQIENGETFYDGNKAWRPRLLAENYFLRAWIHFTLVKIFAPPYGADNESAAIILKLKKSENTFDLQPLSTVQTVYDTIIADLKQADRLPSKYNPEIAPEAYMDRATKEAASFLLVRVYFQMGEEYWDNALTTIDRILQNPQYNELPRPDQAFIQVGLGNKSDETVFYYANYAETLKDKRPSMWNYFGATSGRRFFAMSDQLMKYIGWDNQEYRENDLRYSYLFQYNTPPNDWNVADKLLWAEKWGNALSNQVSTPLMRVAELYLTRSLIRFRKGDKEGAASDLNKILVRASLDETDAENITEEMIHKERAKELFLEGDRLSYLQALQIDVPQGDRNGEALPWNSEKLYLKIPKVEIDANPNINDQ